MTFRFQSRATADVLMLRADGDAVLRMIGRSPAAVGIIETEAPPAAIAAIERAVAHEAPREASPPGSSDPEERTADALAQAVSLRQRTWPLLQMLRTAHASAVAVTWSA
ncbi:DUF1840 family protein [Rubrivivax sp. RP6-9]|uniref:DUF1840 family protein n=1 Tax=Rubrivivax sp. RP6-9 TaxID=3415750 RepID=UPI003CC65B14